MDLKSGSLKRITLKVLRIFGWIVASIFGLMILIALLIQIPVVQQKIKNTAVSFVADKIGTKVALDHISLSIPKKVVLEGIYLEDQKNDTLLYVGKLSVDTYLFALIGNKIELNDISIEDFKASVTRTSDSVFNFDYIIDAFSDSTAAPKDTTQNGWTFSIVDVNLNRFKVSYNDAVAGDDVSLKLNELALSMDEFDLDALRFNVDEFLLAGVDVMITQSKLPTQTSTSSEEEESSSNIDFMIRAVDLRDININYSQLATKQEMMLNLGESILRVDEIDLAGKKIAVDKFSLDKTFVAYHILPGADTTSSKQEAKGVTSDNNSSWTFSLDELALNNNSLQYYDFNKPRASVGIDFNHLWVSGFNFAASDIAFSDEEYQVVVNHLTLHERSGFDVKAFTANLKVNETEAQLSNCLFQTNSTQVHLDASGKFSSLKDLSSQYPEMEIDCRIDETHLGIGDLDFFVPSWSDKIPIKKDHLTDIHLTANVHGKVKDLIIEQIALSTLEKTAIVTTGSIKNLPDIEKASFDIHLDKFYTTSTDVKSLLADTLLPTSIALPSWVELSGDFSGTISTPSVKSQIKSEFGSALINASLDTQLPTEKYKGTVSIDTFNLAKLLKQTETFGLIDLDASIDGAGFNLEDMQGNANVKLNRFDYNDYTYRDFVVEGDFRNYLFSGKASIDDPNLKFEFDGDLDYNLANEKREYHFDFKLENADFKALHLTERPLKARFDLSMDLDNADPRDLNGNLRLHHVAIYNGEELYKVDSLLFASIHDDENTELSVSSDLVNGKFSGSFDLLDLPDVMSDYFNTYYEFQDSLNYPSGKLQQFSFDLQINSTRLLTDVLIPDLKRFVPGEIKGEFNNLEKKLDVSIVIDEIEYGNIMGEGLKFSITSNPKTLDYEFKTAELEVSVVSIPSLDFSGNVSDNKLTTHLVLYDSLEKERYVLGGIFTSIKDAFKFHLLPDEVILDYDEWAVPEENFVTIAKSGFTTSDFRLENGSQQITVDVNDSQKGAVIQLNKLELSTLTRMVFSNDTLVNGIIQGKIGFNQVDSTSLLDADIAISDVSLSRSRLGDLHIVAKQPGVNEYNFGLDVKGPATQIDVQGNYQSKDTTQHVNVNGKVSSLDLAAIEPLLFGQAKQLKGNLTGQIDMTGNTNKPEINGKFTFQNTSVVPTYLNTPVKLDNETITFSQKEIAFKNFQIKDEKNNPLSINGRVEFGADSNHKLDLTTKANKFLLLNTTEDSGNDLFFGKVIVDADIRITGTTIHPEMDMQLSLGDESNFTYVVPESEKGVMEREGVVKFVDRDVHKDPFLAAVSKEAKSREDSVSTIQGVTLTAKIEINDKETLNILIDPITGDKLTVNGNATLTLDIDETGNMNLTGRYELTSGSYGLTFYKLVKRDFEIQKGSTITWSGEPLDADLDITGLYKVETSPAELLQTQSSSANSDQLKQRLPFVVNLNVDGKILSPIISFSIDMPVQRREALGGSVYARLQDINTRESDLNKQVFALLILKRFVADNPFETQGGATLESAARTSVSRFLTDQLNQMSENVKGVQLTFDLKSYEDFSGDQATDRTELQLGLSKTLFSDRLVVKLSGNVDLEGQDTPQNFSDYIGDLALEYKMTEDGRLRVTGFYNSDYDMIDGELKEAGVGLIYIKDYDTLRELFKANDKEEK